MQHRHSSIRIVDNLAEITSHHDRQVLEKSLLKTLNELFPAQGLRLFRVRKHQHGQDISLLAFCVNNVIVSSEEQPTLNPEVGWLADIMDAAIDREDIQQHQDADGSWHLVYPAFDSHGDIFAILVHHCDSMPVNNDQRLVHGILKVYANYLALIDKTQRDKLTSLFNRETLDEQITKILVKQSDELNKLSSSPNDSRRRRYAIKHWLGIVDIDNFKFINDNYGHLYGDEVIILVARLMTSGAIRDDDLVYRYGGEEFVVLLKAANEGDALLAFERLRQMVGTHNFPQLDKVTVSIGFVEVAEQSSPADVIGQADDALYFAKQNGRDQVHSYRQLLLDGKIAAQQPLAFNNGVELF
ncbi:MAG: GGDEF domain-containing protein [Methylophaga sp.]|nr:GGDEF domain-containing protein [Methylophaga sp.]